MIASRRASVHNQLQIGEKDNRDRGVDRDIDKEKEREREIERERERKRMREPQASRNYKYGISGKHV